MADHTLALTHYWPWTGDEQRAVCGAFMHDDARRHSLEPTCPVCAARLAEADATLDATVTLEGMPLDAEEAAALPQPPAPAPARYQTLAATLLDAMRFWSVAGADEKHLQACIADLLEQELAEMGETR